MGIKEGYKEGYRIAEAIYNLSSKYKYVYDPELDKELKVFRVSEEDIKKLALRLSFDRDEIGNMLAKLAFILRHGTIWNADELNTKK